MPTDIKPTTEELQAQLEKGEAELEAAIKDGETEIENEKDDEEEIDTNEEDSQEEVDASKGDEESSDDEKDEEVEVEADKAKKDPDYKEKFKASSRESQKLAASRRKVNEAMVEAAKLTELTDEEMVKEYPEWEDMTDTEKKLAKQAALGEKRFSLIGTASEEADKIEKWNDTVEDFIGDPQSLIDNPDLDGKEAQFKAYASEEAHSNIPMDVLVGAFLQKQSQEKRPKHKGKMFENGTGGANTKKEGSEDGKLSIEDGRKLMQTNYNAYKEALKAGKIRTTV